MPHQWLHENGTPGIHSSQRKEQCIGHETCLDELSCGQPRTIVGTRLSEMLLSQIKIVVGSSWSWKVIVVDCPNSAKCQDGVTTVSLPFDCTKMGVLSWSEV